MKSYRFTIFVLLLTVCSQSMGTTKPPAERSNEKFSNVIVPIGNHWHILEHYKLSKLTSSKIFSLYVTKESLFRLRVEPAATVERSDKQYEIRLTIINSFGEEIQSGLWSLRGRLRPGAHRLLLSATVSAERHATDRIPKRLFEDDLVNVKGKENNMDDSKQYVKRDLKVKREDYYENTQFDNEENDDIDLEMDLYAADEKVINSCIEEHNDDLPEIPFNLIEKTGKYFLSPSFFPFSFSFFFLFFFSIFFSIFFSFRFSFFFF